MFLLSITGQFIFCCELCLFITFSHVCQINVSEVLIIHFLEILSSKVIITIWVPNWGQFLEVQLWMLIQLQIDIWDVLFDLNFGFTGAPLWSHLCLSWAHCEGRGVNSSSKSIFGLYFLTWIFTVTPLSKPYVVIKIQHFVP